MPLKIDFIFKREKKIWCQSHTLSLVHPVSLSSRSNKQTYTRPDRQRDKQALADRQAVTNREIDRQTGEPNKILHHSLPAQRENEIGRRVWHMGATCLACVCRACVWASVYIRVFIVGRISFTLRPNPHHDLPCLFSPGKYKRFLSPSFASLYLPLNFLYCYLLSLQLVVDNEQFKKAVRLTVCCCSKQILRLSHLFAFARARKDQNRHIFPSHLC